VTTPDIVKKHLQLREWFQDRGIAAQDLGVVQIFRARDVTGMHTGPRLVFFAGKSGRGTRVDHDVAPG
jgi:hypothetical protein